MIHNLPTCLYSKHNTFPLLFIQLLPQGVSTIMLPDTIYFCIYNIICSVITNLVATCCFYGRIAPKDFIVGSIILRFISYLWCNNRINGSVECEWNLFKSTSMQFQWDNGDKNDFLSYLFDSSIVISELNLNTSDLSWFFFGFW